MSGTENQDEAEVVSVTGKADGDAQAALRLPGEDKDIPIALGDGVPDDARETLEAALPDDAPFSIARGKAGEETASVPVAGGVDWNMGSSEFRGAGVSEFDRIRDDRIQRIRQASVDYDHLIAEWIFTKDDLVPGIAERMKALIVGESGLQVKPADADSEADQNFADWLQDDVFGEQVRPNDVVSTALRENMKHARAVLRSTDLRRLEIDKLTYVRDAMTGDEVYIQDAQSVAKIDEDAIDDQGELVSGTSSVVDQEQVDQRVLKLGEQVFHTRLYKNAPLEAVADDVVNKLVLKRLKARRAEIASIGGIYIKVEPPAGLPEEEYHAKEEVDWSDEPVTKLEKAMKEGIDDAFDTLSDYKAGSIMAIPENWSVESVELPDDDVPLDEQIRGYNTSIANRLLFPLDLFELKEGAELSRDTIFKTLITTIEGWRQEFIRVFEQFADIQAEIYGVDGDVEFEFPALGAEDEEILVKLLKQAGAAGMSRAEVRQLMNRIEGVDLEIEPERPAADPSTEPGGPSGQERQDSMEDALERQGDDGDQDGGGDGGTRQVDTSGDAGRVLDDDVVGSVGIPGDPLFANVPGVDDPETGFKPGAPEGWTRQSVVDAWTSLGGSFTSCVAEMTGDVRSPEAFCAALKDEFLGTENWRKGSAASASVIQASTTYGYRVQSDGSAEAASKTSFQIRFDGDLEAAADMLQDVLESNGEDSSIVHEGDDYRVIDFGPDGSDSTQVVLSETGDGEYVVAGRGRDASLFDGLEERVDAARSAAKVEAARFKLEKDAASLREAASMVRRLVEDRVPDGYTADTKRKGDDQFVVFVRDEAGDFAGSLVLSEGIDGGYVVVGTSNFFDVDRPPVGDRDLTRVEGSSQDDDGDGSNGGLIGKFLGTIGLQAANGDGPLADVPGLPASPDVITRPMLEYWLAWLRSQDAAQATLQADWNPAFHPRGPDGKFVERPFDIPDAIRNSENLDFSQQSGAEILAEISDFEKGAVREALQDPDISIDGVPDDVNDRKDLKAVATRHSMERKQRENTARDQLKDQVQNADSLDDVPTRTVDRDELERNDIILVDGEPRSVESAGFNSGGYGRVKKPDGEIVDGFQAGEQVEKVQGAGVMYDLPGVELPPKAGGRNDVPDDMALGQVADVIPKGQDSPLKKPDEGPISDAQMDDVRSTMADVLERANAPDVAREYGRRTGYVADDIDRSHNGFRQNAAGEDMNGMALSEGAPASTVRHEMGHGVAAMYGFSNSDNSAAHDMDYWPDIDPDSGQFKRYMVSDEIAAFGPTADATGFDDWAEEERQRVLQFDDSQFEPWDGRNRATALEPGDVARFDVVRFDDTPTPATRSRTLEVVGVDEDAGMSDEVELSLRNQDGDVVERRVDGDGTSFFADIEAVNRGATDPDAAANGDPTAWTEDRSADWTEYRGSADREPGEKVRDLVSGANRAFFNMHLTKKYVSDDDAESKTIISGYSSTNAHEVLSQTHELLQRDGPTPPNLKEKIKRLPENHPYLFAKYTDIWTPSPEVQDILADAGVEK